MMTVILPFALRDAGMEIAHSPINVTAQLDGLALLVTQQHAMLVA